MTIKTHKILIICDKGFEKECGFEIQTLFGEKKIDIHTQYCICELNSEELLTFVYQTQTALKVFIILSSYEFSESLQSDFLSHIGKIEWTNWIDSSHSFKVTAKIPQPYDSQEFAGFCGGRILEQVSDGVVDVQNPSTHVRIQYLQNKLFICIDCHPKNLEKREYKIYTQPTTIRSSIAANMVLYARPQKNDKILDPFCGCGTIPIEAGFFCAQKSPRFYEKDLPILRIKEFSAYTEKFFADIDTQSKNHEMTQQIIGADILGKSVDATKKNAKIAGILSHLSIIRSDVDWIDTKFEPKSISKVITVPPFYAEHNQKKLTKTYTQFFKRSHDFLTDDGKIYLLTNNPEFLSPIAQNFYLKCHTHECFMGQTKLYVLTCYTKKEEKNT
ncbi:MAG: methyltransferase [Candidatus Woesearchaeota archaeon]